MNICFSGHDTHVSRIIIIRYKQYQIVRHTCFQNNHHQVRAKSDSTTHVSRITSSGTNKIRQYDTHVSRITIIRYEQNQIVQHTCFQNNHHQVRPKSDSTTHMFLEQSSSGTNKIRQYDTHVSRITIIRYEQNQIVRHTCFQNNHHQVRTKIQIGKPKDKNFQEQ